MTKNDRIFVDGMTGVKMIEGVVHMTFFNTVGNHNESCGEICMTQQAFLNAFGAMENLVTQLIDAGLVRRNSEQKDAPEKTSESPNFS